MVAGLAGMAALLVAPGGLGAARFLGVSLSWWAAVAGAAAGMTALALGSRGPFRW
jgi:hypothetical protein